MKNSITIFLFIAVVFSATAQEMDKKDKLPKSIYTYSTIDTPFYDSSTINKNLNVSELSFFIVSKDDIDNGSFSIPFNKLGKKPTSLIYDDYIDYQRNNLLKGFLRKYDPARWSPQQLQLQ
ncbi:hypothetical protein P8625_08665 [Tenacibaculum tangerinum]|uniref:Uncharacterized protein n=1 Tax=Tenacibaculum tangerinum TaxID=3038772 RepID=A0ABY8L1G9_9FLAO|nr:hypothetical protein [Tenacibaculum tangerinum]WGH74193.1 hypothetical protein P8625_08665 [Tenacibaculum tangerinum]